MVSHIFKLTTFYRILLFISVFKSAYDSCPEYSPHPSPYLHNIHLRVSYNMCLDLPGNRSLQVFGPKFVAFLNFTLPAHSTSDNTQ
jgi:hypothetical protein